MVSRFTVAPLSTMTRTLADVAMGRQPPDMVITGGRLLSTYSERILDRRELWIKAGRIAAIKPAGSYPLLPGDHTVRYDARGGIIAPGLVDPHVHIESSLVSACAYAEGALLNGTTTIFCDCHDIANVVDMRGIKWIVSDARKAPMSIFFKVPGAVPSTHGEIETAVGDMTAAKVAEVFESWPEAVALGGKMDFVQVAAGDERSHAILAEALKRGKPVSGHIYGLDFVAANAASGVSDIPGAADVEMADECLEAGMWVFLRGAAPGTPGHSLPDAIKTITEMGANPKRICVCTGDRDADDLFHFGLDWVVRQSLAAGLSRATAWSLGSLHPATRFGMENEIGGLGPGRRADIVLLNDDLEVQNTWYGGQLVVENRKITAVLDRALSKRYTYPIGAYRTVKAGRRIKLTPELPRSGAIANVIKVSANSRMSFEHEKVWIEGGTSWPVMLKRHGLCFVTVVGRHSMTANMAHGFLKNFGLSEGAVGSSVGHDAHNTLLAGSNEADMKIALAAVKEMRGGLCVVRDGTVIAAVALPVAGLLSDKRATDVAKEMVIFKKAWAEIGCTLPFTGFSLVPMTAAPEIRLTDKGLFHVPSLRPLALFEPVG